MTIAFPATGDTCVENGGSIAAPVPALARHIQARFIEVLRQTGYLSVFELHGRDPSRTVAPMPPTVEVLRRLFIAGMAIPGQEAAQALTPGLLEPLIESGLLARHPAGVRSLYQVQVYRGLVVLADFLSQSGPRDLVLPIGPSGRYLAASTVRRRVRVALDLGCGCGIQALLAARHAESVTATDINPRALALTMLNASLNKIDNIVPLEGSYLEPVTGRAYDVITCNLPYVITPENKFLYRDSGMPGDQSLWRVVRELPGNLSDGGFAHVMVNWTHAASRDWWQEFRIRVSGLSADAWLVCHQTLEPEPYARMWTDFKDPRTGSADEVKQHTWLDWYKSMGIERISLGMLTLRGRTAARHWYCATSVNAPPRGDTGDQLRLLIELQDYLASLDSRHALLKGVFARRNIALKAEHRSKLVSARTTHGYPFQCSIHPASARVLDRLNGAINLRTAMQRAGEGSDSDQVLDEDLILGDIHTLLCFGMIQPA